MSYTSRRHSHRTHSPFMFFFLLSCFGILFVGCGSSTDIEKDPADLPDVIFTNEDLENIEKIANTDDVTLQLGASGRIIPTLTGTSSIRTAVVEDHPMYPLYAAMRSNEDGQFTVTNDFVNVRSEPKITAPLLTTFKRGDTLIVKEFYSNAWAKISYNNADAYVSKRYIAKLVTESGYIEDRKQYDGLYFVDFDFLNVRSSPDVDSEKIAELPGQTIIKPLSLDNIWARVQVDNKEGYIAREYLTKFEPDYIVRQSEFSLPVVTIDASEPDALATLVRTITVLKNQNKKISTFHGLYTLLQQQQTKDVRLEPDTVILAIVNTTPETINTISDTVYAANVKATAFIATKYIGIDGITERKILNIQANGIDVQSGGHTLDDFRSLTTDQLRLELSQSKQILSELTGMPIVAIAYPGGTFNDRVLDNAAKSGYLFGSTGNEGVTFDRKNLLSMPRVRITATMSDADIIALLNGAKVQSTSSASVASVPLQ
jgi:uncharacterized protein YgiM (DUF1202 family)